MQKKTKGQIKSALWNKGGGYLVYEKIKPSTLPHADIRCEIPIEFNAKTDDFWGGESLTQREKKFIRSKWESWVDYES